MTLVLLDVTLPTPEENLALDEALLLECEATTPDNEAPCALEVLRFWESPTCFVTLGVSGRLHADVDVTACEREGVPILRRASGGGTVVQGPGCLNFALVLSLEARPELRDLTRSYAAILSRVARCLGGDCLTHSGTSDLAIAGRKLSGNAQKRTRRALLHHGTILHDFDIPRIERLLKEPEKQPDYRSRRPHGEFVRNIELPAAEIKARIASEWDADPPSAPFRLPDLSGLIVEKYGHRAWTERF